MNKAEIDSNGAVKYLGMQPHDTAIQYIASADVLLSIGNVESPMAPSKIYEYMATGKPIIHTYTYEKDPCIEPLNKYGNSLILKNDDKNALEKAMIFINQITILNYEEVRSKFLTSTPYYSADLISKS